VIAALFALALFIAAGLMLAWLDDRKRVKGRPKRIPSPEPSACMNLYPPALGSGARRYARQIRSRGKGAFAPASQESVCEPGYGDPWKVFSVAQAFDPDYAILWETQVPALELIDAAGLDGVHARQLYGFYRSSARLYPELFDNSTFRSWLQFLEQERLITRVGKRVFITAEGHAFFAFITSCRYRKPA
jgi:hypothetical protein